MTYNNVTGANDAPTAEERTDALIIQQQGERIQRLIAQVEQLGRECDEAKLTAQQRGNDAWGEYEGRIKLQAELEEAYELVDPAMWVAKNYEEWLDAPADGDAFKTLMAALADLSTYLGKKGTS